MKKSRFLLVSVLLILGLVACTIPSDADEISWGDKLSSLSLSEAQVDTLQSLQQIDEYPLYTMHFYAPYETLSSVSDFRHADIPSFDSTWGCSLFTTFADPDNLIFGRNFDWEYSPALLLFTDPSDGYASASMIDIKYIGYWNEDAHDLDTLPLAERLGLLDAYLIPFDGINETGLAVGMAAVPGGNMSEDPEKETINSLLVIREILDHASTVEEAVSILGSFNIDYGNGPALHYLVADANHNSALVEFFHGEMNVIKNQADWHWATNFLLSAAGDSPEGRCWRYDKIHQRFEDHGGRLSVEQAMGLLSNVAQDVTQWSVVYEMSTGEINIVMGKAYDRVHELHLELLRD